MNEHSNAPGSTDEFATSAPPEPSRRLRALDRLVGTWQVSGGAEGKSPTCGCRAAISLSRTSAWSSTANGSMGSRSLGTCVSSARLQPRTSPRDFLARFREALPHEEKA